MTLILAIETSSFMYDVAVGDASGQILARTSMQLRDPGFTSIGYLVESLVTEAGLTFREIDLIAVDAGPGNVISVRAGISYANGLAFSLDKPVVSLDSLTLLAAETRSNGDMLCIRNSGGGTVNAALFRDNGEAAGFHGPLAGLAEHLPRDLTQITVAGTFREQIASLVPHIDVKDSALEFPTVATLCRLAAAVSPDKFTRYVTPITDSSSNSTSVHPL